MASSLLNAANNEFYCYRKWSIIIIVMFHLGKYLYVLRSWCESISSPPFTNDIHNESDMRLRFIHVKGKTQVFVRKFPKMKSNEFFSFLLLLKFRGKKEDSSNFLSIRQEKNYIKCKNLLDVKKIVKSISKWINYEETDFNESYIE